MFIKCNNEPSSMKPQILNPNAQEWRPTPHLMLGSYSPPPLPQPQAAVPVVNFFLPLPGYPSFANPYKATICRPVFASLQANAVCSSPAAPPCSRGEDRPTIRGPKCPPISGTRKWLSPRAGRVMLSSSVEKRPALRQEWRPKKTNFVIGAAGGGTTPSPPSRTPSKPLSSAARRCWKTTIMIKNIPNQLRRDNMLQFLDRCSNLYSLAYDFFYLPMDFRKEDNLGYAFVNFTTPGAALKIKEVLHDYKWNTIQTERGSFKSKKICELAWALIQGKAALVKRFLDSKFVCDKLEFLPVVLDPPRNGSDPEPAPPVVIGRLQGA